MISASAVPFTRPNDSTRQSAVEFECIRIVDGLVKFSGIRMQAQIVSDDLLRSNCLVRDQIVAMLDHPRSVFFPFFHFILFYFILFYFILFYFIFVFIFI